MQPLPAAAIGLVIGALITGTAFSSRPEHDGRPHVPAVGDPAMDSDATAAFRAAVDRLHDRTAIAYGDAPDADYVALMLGLQQTAIELSRAVLDHGHDNALRLIAQEVINQQAAETDRMTNWSENR